MTTEERLFSKIEIHDCWLWRGTMSPNGYGRFFLDGRRLLAHRVVWEWLVGPIPLGLQLDHLCKVRRCVNPDHLEPVTPSENIQRSARVLSHCKYGHPRFGANLYVSPKGLPDCRICRRRRDLTHRRRHQAEGA